MLEISVLGPVEVARDGRPVPVPGGKTAELLVRLALEAGTTVSADRLADDLWAGAATQRNTLQSKVARLRRALGDAAAIAGAYRLEVDPGRVDALCVLRDASAAAARLEAGDVQGARELSGAALGRFRGELLPAAGDWADPHRAQLEEARAELLETQLAARLRLGETVVPELEAAVAAAPYRERLWELLILALYRAGRQADALAAYRRVRSVLADDLGLEPGPRLQELERQVLHHDPALRAAPAGNLPSLRPALVGRDEDVRVLGELLRTERLVEIVGPGGIGKTAVALATAATLPGTVWLVRLETAATGADVLDAVIAALGVSGGEAALLERLRPAATVLVLDNCEHVREAPRRSPCGCSTRSPGCGCSPPARSRSTSTARRSTSSPRSGSTTPSSCSRGARPARARTRASCAARSTASRSRSSSPPRAPRRSRSRRSRAGSTTASACCTTR